MTLTTFKRSIKLFRAAWYGARITFRQVSPEANTIFDLLIELHRCCNGNWPALLTLLGEDEIADDAKQELDRFMEYAALFLSNQGNYYVSHLFQSDFQSDSMTLAGPR